MRCWCRAVARRVKTGLKFPSPISKPKIWPRRYWPRRKSKPLAWARAIVCGSKQGFVCTATILTPPPHRPRPTFYGRCPNAVAPRPIFRARRLSISKSKTAQPACASEFSRKAARQPVKAHKCKIRPGRILAPSPAAASAPVPVGRWRWAMSIQSLAK